MKARTGNGSNRAAFEMLDIKAIRQDTGGFRRAMTARGLSVDAEEILRLDEERRAAILSLDEARHRRKRLSAQIAAAKNSGDNDLAQSLSEQVKEIKGQLRQWEEQQSRADEALESLLAALPNPPLADVPAGADESANVEQHRFGEAPHFDFPPKDHAALGESLGLMDFAVAARLSGARFTVLRGALARLERALGAFMLDVHTQEFGYQEIAPPLLVRTESMFGTAQLPKFEEDQFSTQSGLWLIPTAEVPLTNLVRESIIAEEELPLRFTAATPCFRKEAGAAGRDTRGMIRQHQFTKVELVSIVRPQDSPAELQRMLHCAETVLQRLELHYRVMLLCAGDMGFAAGKTHDIEIWLPGEGAYREISSCSLCGDFQARRMNARYRRSSDDKPAFVHTLNGSGVALGRALLALLEQKQQADGSINIPAALRPYMGGLQRIERE